MFALMKEDGTVCSLTDGTQPVKWNNMSLPPPRLMTQAERVANRIFDFVQAGSTPDFHDAGGTTYEVDPVGIVREIVASVPWDAAKLGEHRAKEITKKIEELLAALSKAHEYDNIDSTAKYIGYPNEFQAEAIKLATYAASCWSVAKAIRAEVMAGAPLPTVAEAMARMPTY